MSWIEVIVLEAPAYVPPANTMRSRGQWTTSSAKGQHLTNGQETLQHPDLTMYSRPSGGCFRLPLGDKLLRVVEHGQKRPPLETTSRHVTDNATHTICRDPATTEERE